MTHASTLFRSTRPNSEYRWSPSRALAFLEALARCGSVAGAARAVGVSRNSAYRLRERAPAFAEGWLLAQRLGLARGAAPKMTPVADKVTGELPE
jgi:molybdenum-dependent DNA-binding transcriptional regulator ModE